MKEVVAWAGIVEDKIYADDARDAYEPPTKTLAIFTSRRGARARYERVVKVRICEDDPWRATRRLSLSAVTTIARGRKKK